MNRQILVLLLVVATTMVGCRANNSQQPLFGNSGIGGGGFQRPGGSLFGATGFGGNNSAFSGGNPIGNSGSWFTPNNSQFQLQQASAQANQMAGQVGNLSSRLNQFDSDNQNLHAQVAALQQRLQNANNYNDQLKTQLSDQMAQLQQAQVQVQQTTVQAQQQIAAARNMAQPNNTGFQQPNSNFQNAGFQNARFQNPNQNRPVNGQIQGQSAGAIGSGTISSPPSRFTGATIRANNSLMQKLQTVQIPGFKTWMDGDVIRIEGPTDRLFVSGTYQVNQNDAATIGNLANVIRQNFPRQVIGVEAHWDGTPIEPATTSHHQLTATQALAVFDLLVKSGLPHDQVFTMAMGSNRLRYPNGNAANRRIEFVIYPETF